MITIIAGSRDITDCNALLDAIEESRFDITEVVSGAARGVDSLGEAYAHCKEIPCTRFPAQWENLEAEPCRIKSREDGTKYNSLAGFARNQQMADYAQACIVVMRPGSRGSKDMLERALKQNLKVYLKEI